MKRMLTVGVLVALVLIIASHLTLTKVNEVNTADSAGLHTIVFENGSSIVVDNETGDVVSVFSTCGADEALAEDGSCVPADFWD